MKIIINGLQINNENSGIGKMLIEVAQKLSIKYDVTIIISKGIKLNSSLKIIEIPFKNSQTSLRNFYQSFILGKKYCKDAVFITSDSKIPLFIPKGAIILPIITDLAVFKMPKVYKKSQRTLWNMQYKLLKKKCKKVIALSDSTKKDIIDELGILGENINVIPCANNLEKLDAKKLQEVKDKYRLPDKYIFFIGNLNPRKNVDRLYEAYQKIKQNLPHKLVIAGPNGWKYEKLLTKLKNDSDVIFLGYVTEEEKSALYTMADVFIMPSLYEGFGIPILEAQACGTPVVTGNVSSMPEVAGDAAVLVDPYSVEEIENAIEKLLNNEKLRNELIEKGYENVKRFSWDKTADKISEVIEKL